jgi:hypothetical protein
LNRFYKYILLVLIFTTSKGYSQSDFSIISDERFSDVNHWIKSYPHHVIDGVENSFLKNETPYKLIAGASAIIILSNYDQDLKAKFLNKPFFSNGLSKQADNFGKTFGWGYFAGAGFITLESIISKNNRSQYFSKMELMLESIAVTQVITQTLKMTVKRERPNQSDNHSFPSGHSSSVFALATSLNSIYGWKVGVPAFICASVVGAQRVSSSSHYLTDVATGALIGYLVAEGFTELHSK